MRIEILGIEFLLRSVRGNKDQLITIPVKDYQAMQRELRVMRLRT